MPGELSTWGVRCSGSGAPTQWGAWGAGCLGSRGTHALGRPGSSAPGSGVPREWSRHALGCPGSSAPKEQGAWGLGHPTPQVLSECLGSAAPTERGPEGAVSGKRGTQRAQCPRSEVPGTWGAWRLAQGGGVLKGWCVWKAQHQGSRVPGEQCARTHDVGVTGQRDGVAPGIRTPGHAEHQGCPESTSKRGSWGGGAGKNGPRGEGDQGAGCPGCLTWQAGS